MALKLTKKTDITVTVPYSEDNAEKAKSLLETIVSNTNLNELEIIANVSKNSELKTMALNTAKKLL